jgi:hypothetical protein
MAEVFSLDIRDTVIEMLQVNCEKRPCIDDILRKPFILRHIKMNLVKESDLKKRISYYKEKLNFCSKENNKKEIDKENNIDKENINLNKGLINLGDLESNKENMYDINFSKDIFVNNESNNELSSNDKKQNTLINIFINDERNETYKNNKQFIDLNSNIVINKIEKMKKILQKIIGIDEFYILYDKLMVNFNFKFLKF